MNLRIQSSLKGGDTGECNYQQSRPDSRGARDTYHSRGLARRGQIGLIRELVLSLVVNAEKEYGAKTGPIKKSDVTAKIYSMLPTASKLLISSGTVSDLIEEAKERMDETLPKNEEE